MRHLQHLYLAEQWMRSKEKKKDKQQKGKIIEAGKQAENEGSGFLSWKGKVFLKDQRTHGITRFTENVSLSLEKGRKARCQSKLYWEACKLSC